MPNIRTRGYRLAHTMNSETPPREKCQVSRWEVEGY
jgi:hypothetical protein